MADVQPQFEGFHEAIKLGNFDENAELREKRDRILDRLKENLDELRTGGKAPAYETFNQGSYAMGTGVKPLDSDYDIDVGIRFKIAKDDYPDPVEVKEWVYEALKGHTKRVEVRRSCVTVYYSRGDEPIYHVDLAIYSDRDCNPDGKMYLAKGRLNSAPEYRVWEPADPQGLMDLIAGRFPDPEDAKQFRRVVRYLKRWRDVKFTATGNAAPIGIGLTVAAYLWFSPTYKVPDPFSGARRYNDLPGLYRLISAMLGRFTTVYAEGEWAERLRVELPVEPHNDLFGKMTNLQMRTFKTKLEALRQVLSQAIDEVDPVEACKLLRSEFGDDFPVPSKEETGRKVPPSIISSSVSACKRHVVS